MPVPDFTPLEGGIAARATTGAPAPIDWNTLRALVVNSPCAGDRPRRPDAASPAGAKPSAPAAWRDSFPSAEDLAKYAAYGRR